MKKLKLNKTTISQMDRVEMSGVKGGICLVSCKNGSRKGKGCCKGDGLQISFTTVKAPKLVVPLETLTLDDYDSDRNISDINISDLFS